MANVNITTALSGGKRQCRNIVFTSAAIGYAFFQASGGFVYRKTTDGGATWGSNVVIQTAIPVAYDVWFDQWTPGNTGTLIHTWYFDVTNNKVFYRNLDTNGDTLGTERTVFTGVSAVAGRGAFVSGTRSRSGRLYAAWDLDAGAEFGWRYSTDLFVTPSSGAATFVEATIDECLLFPASNTGDNDDIWMIYQDASVDALTMKFYDASGDTVVESSTMQTMVENVTDGTGQRGFTGAVRFSDGHLIVVSCSERDTASADMQALDVSAVNSGSLTGITAKTDITTNIDDNYYPALCIDQDTDTIYVAYNGKRDGSEVLGTTTKIYYTKSTDGGSTWTAGDTALDEGTATTNFQVWAPLSGHRFTAAWLTSASLITNKVNSVVLYTLVAGQGSFTKTGQAVNLLFGHKLTADQGSFSLTGEAANLLVGRKLDLRVVADSYSEDNVDSFQALSSSGLDRQGASQAFTAVAGPFDRAVFFISKSGSPTGNALAKLYNITGTFGTNAKPTGTALATSDNFDVSTLTTTPALTTFQFSGVNRYLLTGGAQYCITVEYALGDHSNHLNVGYDSLSPTHAGNSAALNTGTWQASSTIDFVFYVYVAQGQGSFSETGEDVTLTYTPGAGSTYTLTAAQGSFSDSGQTANLLIGHKLAADFASFSDTGQSVAFYKGRTLAIGQGSFTLTGEDVTLKVSVPAAQGSFTFTGQSVNFYKGKTLSVSSGSFTLSGQTASFLYKRVFQIGQGSFTVTGQSAALNRGRFVIAAAGTFVESGQAIGFLFGRVMALGHGTFPFSGQSVDFVYTPLAALHAFHGEFALNGQDIFFSFNYAVLKLDFDAPTHAEAQFNGAGEAESQISIAPARSRIAVGKAGSSLTTVLP